MKERTPGDHRSVMIAPSRIATAPAPRQKDVDLDHLPLSRSSMARLVCGLAMISRRPRWSGSRRISLVVCTLPRGCTWSDGVLVETWLTSVRTRYEPGIRRLIGLRARTLEYLRATRASRIEAGIRLGGAERSRSSVHGPVGRGRAGLRRS